MGFQDYLTMLRINRAKELLRSTNLSISEVCYQVGYQDIRTFNRVFKARGRTPAGRVQKALWYVGAGQYDEGGKQNAGEEKAIHSG